MSYKLSTPATDDMFNLYVDGEAMFGQRQAEQYYQTLEKAFELLSRYPEAAPEKLECIPPVRIYPCGSHIIVYRVETFGVWILRVCHAREDWVNIDWSQHD